MRLSLMLLFSVGSMINYKLYSLYNGDTGTKAKNNPCRNKCSNNLS